MFNNFCYFFFLLQLWITFWNPKIVYSDEIRFKNQENFNWEIILINSDNNDWTLTDKPYEIESNSEENFDNVNIYNFAKKPLIRSTGQSITYNGYPYPDLSIYVPNGFLTDQDRVMTIGLRGIGRVRHCASKKIISENCTDAVLNIDTSIFKGDDFTFDLKLTTASLSNRGTDFGEGISLGFKNFLEERINAKVLGPVSAPIFKLKKKFRIRLLIRGSKSLELQNIISKLITKYKFSKGIKLTVDVDPINFN